MPKDRSWVLLDDHRLEAFQNGCVEFLDFVFAKCAIDNKIRCPCRDCKCRKFGDRDFVHKHLLWRGWDKLYGKGRWRFHLESEEEYDAAEMNDANAVQIPELLVVPQSDGVGIDVGDNMNELLHACLHQDQQEPLEEPIPEADDLRKLIEEWCIPLHDGCREYSKLSFIMEFYKIKSRGKMSDKTFTETLQLMKKIQYLNIPDSFYEVKKLIGKLGCGYVKIDACENDCMLFWNDDLNLNTCKVCNASRWRNPVENEPSSSTTQRNRVPKKVLRHFPLIPRLKRLFICEKTYIFFNFRYLGHLKTFVRNKKCPEGSIAECYITEECLNFCALYTKSSSANIRDDEKQCSEVRPKYRILSYDEMEKAHNYCLFNTDEVQPYIEEHFETIKNKVSTSDPTYHWRIQQLQDKEFRHWFQSNVQGKIGLSEDLKGLARSPQYRVQTFKRFEVQGFMFRTKSSEESRYTQNSGVFVKAHTTSFASAKDKSPKKEDVGYYGVIKDIIEVSFGVGTKKVVLFECDCANIRMNKTDSLGFTLVNLAKPDVRVSPFVLPSQVLQTLYVEDPRDRPWMVPIVIKPRDNFALRPEDPSIEVEDGCYEILPINSDTIVIDDMEE